jgi:hypothetical protein
MTPNDYTSKLAREAFQQGKLAALRVFKLSAEDEASTQEKVLKALGGAATPIAVNTGAGVAYQAMSPPQTGSEDFSNKKNFRALEKAMGLSGTEHRKHLGGAGMGYVQGRPTVFLPPGVSEATAAHELGHAKNWEAARRLVGSKGRDALLSARLLSMMGGVDSAIPLSAYAAADSDMSWTPAAIQAGLFAPTLVDEGLASLHAARHLVNRHGLIKGVGRSASLLPAYGTYAALGLSPAAITGGRKAWKSYSDKKDKKNKSKSSH